MILYIRSFVETIFSLAEQEETIRFALDSFTLAIIRDAFNNPYTSTRDTFTRNTQYDAR